MVRLAWWDVHEATKKLTCAIITTRANDLLCPIQDEQRMPVILDREQWDGWLNEKDLKLLQPYPAEKMYRYKVGRFVNYPKQHKGTECLTPQDEHSL